MSVWTSNNTFEGWIEEPIDRLIRRVRTYKGKSQRTLAEMLCEVSGNPSVTPEVVSRWEHGGRTPTPYWRGHLATALNIPLDILDRAAAIAKAERAARQRSQRGELQPQEALPSPGRSEVTDRQVTDTQLPSAQGTAFFASMAMQVAMPGSIGEDMNRGQFLSLMGATAAGAFAEEAYELLRISETSGPSETTVSILEQALNALDETYCSTLVPAQQLVGPVGQHFAAARRMLSDEPGEQRRRLYTVASQAATLLGCLAFDLHDLYHARLYLHTAEQAAYEAGNPSLAGYAISNRSLHDLTIGDPQSSVRLIRQAQKIAARSAPEPLRAWLAAMEARALADLGETHACNQALETASSGVARGRPPGALAGGMTFFSDDRLVWYEAICRAHLGETEAARSLLAKAEATVRPKMIRRTLIRLEVATTYAREGDVKQASDIAIQALDMLPRDRRIAAVTNRATKLDAQLMSLQPSHPATREFHEQLLAIQ